MENTPQKTFEVIKEGAEKARGVAYINVRPDDLLAAFEYLEGNKSSSGSAPKKIES